MKKLIIKYFNILLESKLTKMHLFSWELISLWSIMHYIVYINFQFLWVWNFIFICRFRYFEIINLSFIEFPSLHEIIKKINCITLYLQDNYNNYKSYIDGIQKAKLFAVYQIKFSASNYYIYLNLYIFKIIFFFKLY